MTKADWLQSARETFKLMLEAVAMFGEKSEYAHQLAAEHMHCREMARADQA
jgi:hypothetical protein